MNSRNQKQEELIRRLETIRQQRTTIQTEQNEKQVATTKRRNEQTSHTARRKRNQGQQTNTPQNRRDKTLQTSRTKKNQSDSFDNPGQYSQEKRSSMQKSSNDFYTKRISEAKKREQLKAKQLADKKSKSKKNQPNSLIDKLSDKDSLRDAIILNEVLSKPIALRRHSR